ncbi:MAG: hypothetical protein OWR52_04970 [Acidibacillus sp.]|uniref:Uncharacterized protein n=1 Tax=Sulfoacidibacillus ferrooxidans TaxID=2005001 RepID=A0A9X2AAQ8_9BACL|nr:hypothetical protein [Sulfoacidibacillus ferrooxidans]MCI0181854.1 hypothetical protein [Sulfoacidibacillus ferrooxidans]MCY0892849.1 hypothetical protein [Acidibacillus sp.]
MKRQITIPQLTIVSVLLMLVLMLSPIVPVHFAHAATGSERPVTSTIYIPKKENIDTVISIQHPVIVDGIVTNSIIAVGGNILLRPGSYSAFVLSIGGNVTQEPGAVVSEGLFAIGPDKRIFTTLTLASFLSIGLYFINTSLAAVLFVTFAAGGSIIFRRDERISAFIGRKYIRLFATGITITIIPAILIIASFVSPSIWMATIAIFLLYALLGLSGMILVTNKIGRTIIDFTGRKTGRIAALYGAIAILLVTNLPLVGILSFLALWILGVGSMWTLILRPSIIRI